MRDFLAFNLPKYENDVSSFVEDRDLLVCDIEMLRQVDHQFLVSRALDVFSFMTWYYANFKMQRYSNPSSINKNSQIAVVC